MDKNCLHLTTFFFSEIVLCQYHYAFFKNSNDVKSFLWFYKLLFYDKHHRSIQANQYKLTE